MQKIFLFLAFVLLSFKFSFSQSAKAIFVEAGGPGLASLNYDQRFTGKEDGIGGRIGMGGFQVEGEGAVFIPVTINYIMSKNKKDYFEIGAGATIVPVSSAVDGGPFTNSSGHLNFGYRYQPQKGGFFFRATVNPIFGPGFFWPYYGGISVGYKL